MIGRSGWILLRSDGTADMWTVGQSQF